MQQVFALWRNKTRDICERVVHGARVAMNGAPLKRLARTHGPLDRLGALPEVLFDIVLMEVSCGAWRGRKETFKVLLGLVERAFKDLCNFRLACSYVVNSEKQFSYFYDLTWKLWSLRNVEDLAKPGYCSTNASGSALKATNALEHLSYTKDQELYRTILSLYDRNMSRVKRFLRYHKNRRSSVREELAELNVTKPPPPPE